MTHQLIKNLLAALMLICISANAAFCSDKEFYANAQKELDSELYTIYRTAERIIRTNGLDDYPWIVEIPTTEDYKVNAATSEGNLILINRAITTTFIDDASSLAFILAHEMAHQSQKHRRQKSRNAEILEDQLKEANELYKRKEEKLEEKKFFFSSHLNPFGKYHLKKQIKREKQKIDELKKQLEADALAFSRKKEYEADRLALKYILTAGFTPQGAIKTLEFLERIDSPFQEHSAHPDVKNRQWQIKTQLKNLDTKKLKSQGIKKLNSSMPLKYSKKGHYKYKFLVKKILVIKSKCNNTNNANKQFEKLFGY